MIPVSVIIVCLNDAERLDRTLKGVDRQNFADFEVVVVDGGSTDETPDVLRKYEKLIDVAVSEPDSGIFNAQNKGFDLSSGEYVLFLNAGDRFCNSNVLNRIFSRKPEYDLLIGDIAIEYPSGFKTRKPTPKGLTPDCFLVDAPPHQATFAKRSAFEKIGGLDESYKISADYDFLLKALFKFDLRVEYLGFPVSIFPLDGVSKTSEGSELFAAERERALRDAFGNDFDEKLKSRKFLLYWFYKKPRYLFFGALSFLSPSFVGCERDF